MTSPTFKERLAILVEKVYEQGLEWSGPDALDSDEAIAQGVYEILTLVKEEIDLAVTDNTINMRLKALGEEK